MIGFSIDQSSQQRLQTFLRTLGPRLMVELHQALKTLLYTGVQTGVQRYFAGSGPKGGPTSNLLTSRSGVLVNSLLASVETGFDPPSPGAGTTQVTGQIGSALRYARIQEYGGIAGRAGPFKKKNGRRPYLPPRPYLQPILRDLEAAAPNVLKQAVDSALKSQ